MKRGQTVSRFRRWSVHASSRPLRIQVTALIFFFVLASVEVAWGTVPIPPQLRLASIEGTVVDSAGFPVAGATVYLFKNRRTPTTTTNAKGYFVLNEIEVGEHQIFAYKESDGYPNPVWSFYSDALGLAGFPVVYVHRGGALQGIIVRLPPKSSRLTVKINDARTRQALEDATVSVTHEGKPKTEFSSGATGRNGELAILVPPDIAINMKIRRSGYNTSYRSGIQLRAGEERAIEINLTRTNRTSR